MNGRLTLSDPSVKELVKASCSNHTFYDNLPRLNDANWQQWSDALQHAALMAGTDAVLNGESRHPTSLEGKQCTLAEWNENIRRTAVWRCRNECLLKAMRKSFDPSVDLNEFEGLDARRTYLGLKSIYRITDNQQAFNLYSDKLTPYIGLADPPRETANRLREAFDQYNNLVGYSLEQRLPENYLKMAFLDALDSDEYGDWPKKLLKDHNVLALDQGPALTFNELVDLVIAERARLLQEQTDNNTSTPTASQRLPKRNISQVDEPAQPDLHRPFNSPHRDKGRHTNPHSNKTSVGDSSSDESDSEVEHEIEEQIPAGDQDHLPLVKSTEDSNRATTEKEWQDLVAARYAEVKAQRDIVTAGFKGSGNEPRKYPTLRGDLTGEWLLYNKKFNPGTSGHHYIRIWDNNSDKQKRQRPKNRDYAGKLFIGPLDKAETFEITSFTPSHNVTGRRQPIRLTQGNRKARKGWMIFWGNGKMVVTVPAPVIGDPNGTLVSLEFAGIQKKSDSSDDEGNDDQNGDDESGSGDNSDNEERYDRVIRTERQTSVAVKVEENDTNLIMGDDDQTSTTRAIKAEESSPDDSDNNLADQIANIIDIVQKQEEMVNQGATVPLGDIGGKWYFHSPKYHPGLDGGISLSFSTEQDHDTSEQMCAPGHCKPARRQTRYCGELLLKAEEGKPDFDCLIKQFDVPEQTSSSFITILVCKRHDQDTICMHAWFFGNGTMRIELPAAMIPSYQGQDAWITFFGLRQDG
ncbi:hypothetical protein KCU65_g7126, partial [Aureobasidium melanogenum]